MECFTLKMEKRSEFPIVWSKALQPAQDHIIMNFKLMKLVFLWSRQMWIPVLSLKTKLVLESKCRKKSEAIALWMPNWGEVTTVNYWDIPKCIILQ